MQGAEKVSAVPVRMFKRHDSRRRVPVPGVKGYRHYWIAGLGDGSADHVKAVNPVGRVVVLGVGRCVTADFTFRSPCFRPGHSIIVLVARWNQDLGSMLLGAFDYLTGLGQRVR